MPQCDSFTPFLKIECLLCLHSIVCGGIASTLAICNGYKNENIKKNNLCLYMFDSDFFFSYKL